MKKYMYSIFCLLFLFIITLLLINMEKNSLTLYYENSQPTILFSVNQEEITIHSWYDIEDNIYYFFLPAGTNSKKIKLKKDNIINVSINNTSLSNLIFKYENDTIYSFNVTTANNQFVHSICFITSQNLPSIFINTSSSTMELIHTDKNFFEDGTINILDSTGTIKFSQPLQSISGRGNTSWYAYEKKPYSFRLNKAETLCGLSPTTKWCLLANWRDSTKIQNQLVFQLANSLNMEYTPQATWVDLYLNGEYNGNYLLCHAITVNDNSVNISDLEKQNEILNPDLDEYAYTTFSPTQKGYDIINPSDISGGYLIEKDFFSYYEQEPCGFITEASSAFSIKSPQHASKEQINYINKYIQTIETLIKNQNEDITQYLDLNSYSKRYLIDELTLNYDAGITSMYFYKHKNNGLVYSGPIWDYDTAMGSMYSHSDNGKWIDTEETISNQGLPWTTDLLQMDIFQKHIKDNYPLLRTNIIKILEEDLDNWGSLIETSVYLDSIRWHNVEDQFDSFKYGHYQDYRTNLEYLKFFLISRINYLDNLFHYDAEPVQYSTNDDTHIVEFIINDEVVHTQNIVHGASIHTLPSFNEDTAIGWYLQPRNEIYNQSLPILEDTTLILR